MRDEETLSYEQRDEGDVGDVSITIQVQQGTHLRALFRNGGSRSR